MNKINLEAQLRWLAAQCRANARPHAGHAAPEGIRQLAMAEAYDKALELLAAKTEAKPQPKIILGAVVSIRTPGSRKQEARVVAVQRDVDLLDVTIGPNMAGIPADAHRRYVPGRSSTTITLELKP